MATAARLPDLASINRHFQDLLGRRVNGILSSKKLSVGPADRWYGAWYELEDRTVAGAIAVDHPLAVALATSLGMLPAAQVAPLVAAGKLDQTTTENLFECLNVSSHFFHRAFDCTVTIVAVAPNPPRPGFPTFPADARKILTTSPRRIDLSLPIDGYGGGLATLAFL